MPNLETVCEVLEFDLEFAGRHQGTDTDHHRPAGKDVDWLANNLTRYRVAAMRCESPLRLREDSRTI